MESVHLPSIYTETTYPTDSGRTFYGGRLDELLITSGHRRDKNSWKAGGAFAKTSRWVKETPALVNAKRNWFGTMFEWHDFAFDASASSTPLQTADLPTPPNHTDVMTTLGTYGAEAVRRARPGKEIGGLFQFVVELKELPRRPLRHLLRGGNPFAIRQAREFVQTMQALGSEYLNIAFGWKPFVEDIQKLHQTTVTLSNELAKLAKLHGHSQRRRRTIVNKSVSDSDTYQSNQIWQGILNPPGYFVAGGGTRSTTITTQVSQRIWFAGRFRTYIPDFGTPGWTKKATRALYGGLITPDHLYQVVPWSWLLNMGNNWGAILSNISENAAGNLLMDYGYLMQTLRTVNFVQHDIQVDEDPNFIYGAPAGYYIAHETGWESKSRIMADPIGFGTKYDDLSGYQKSILAAVGVTRLRFKSS